MRAAEGPSVPQVEIHGYAIVSDNDCIADASGHTPEVLRNEADWAYFQAELNKSAVTVLGRLGHEANANPKGRLRLILSSSSLGLERRAPGLRSVSRDRLRCVPSDPRRRRPCARGCPGLLGMPGWEECRDDPVGAGISAGRDPGSGSG